MSASKALSASVGFVMYLLYDRLRALVRYVWGSLDVDVVTDVCRKFAAYYADFPRRLIAVRQ